MDTFSEIKMHIARRVLKLKESFLYHIKTTRVNGGYCDLCHVFATFAAAAIAATDQAVP